MRPYISSPFLRLSGRSPGTCEREILAFPELAYSVNLFRANLCQYVYLVGTPRGGGREGRGSRGD